jgi:hypothetical protein
MHDTLFPLVIEIRHDRLVVPALEFSPQALSLKKLFQQAHENAKIYLILQISAVTDLTALFLCH